MIGQRTAYMIIADHRRRGQIRAPVARANERRMEDTETVRTPLSVVQCAAGGDPHRLLRRQEVGLRRDGLDLDHSLERVSIWCRSCECQPVTRSSPS